MRNATHAAFEYVDVAPANESVLRLHTEKRVRRSVQRRPGAGRHGANTIVVAVTLVHTFVLFDGRVQVLVECTEQQRPEGQDASV